MNIKHGLLALLALIITSTALAQKPTCKSLHVGSFKVVTKESGTTLIERTEKYQKEINVDLGYEIIFDISWPDECTYELRPKQLIKGDPAIMGDGTFVLKTIIKEITDKSYTAETSANFSPVVVSFVVDIID